jgi:hypothetical protein
LAGELTMPTHPHEPPRPRPTGPDAEIVRARKLAAQCERDVEKEFEKRSKALLAKFLKLPVQERLEALDNPNLAAVDCANLRRSFVGALNRKQPIKWSTSGSGRFKRIWGRSSQLVPLAVKLFVALVVIGVPSWTAWRNTARALPVTASMALQWESSDHKLKSSSTEGPGDTLIVVRRFPGGFQARKWASGIGYLYTPVDVIGGF